MSLPTRVTVVGQNDLPLATRVTLVDPTGGPLITPAGGTFVWKPGATTDPSKALFGTWAEVWAASQLVKPSRIAFDQTGDTFHIPSKPGGGKWDMTAVDFDGGRLLGLGPTVYMDDGAQLGGTWSAKNVSFISLSSMPVVEAEDGAQITIDEGAVLRTDSSASAPFVHVDTAISFWGLNVRYFSTIYADGQPVIAAEAPAFVGIAFDFATAMSAGCLSGDGDFSVDDLTTRVQANGNPNLSHTQPDASSVSYTYG